MNDDHVADMMYPAMRNRAMARKLASHRALNVREMMVPTDELGRGVYALDRYVDGVDYCDAEKELWIWSIGRRRHDGRIFASTDTRFYQNPDYECLWLR